MNKNEPRLPTEAFEIEISDMDHQEGWTAGMPAGISHQQWPRSTYYGYPLPHRFTVKVPREYRVKGDEFIAVSVFFGSDEPYQQYRKKYQGVEQVFANPTLSPEQEKSPFWQGLLAYIQNPHPMERRMKDILGQSWALIWLTKEEFQAPLSDFPSHASSLYPGFSIEEMNKDEIGTNCFSDYDDPHYIRMSIRKGDVNVGRSMEEFEDIDDPNHYIPIFSEEGKKFQLNQYFGSNHIGGTANPYQGYPEFSPFYIEFEEEMGGMNMGGGNGQIDLLHDMVDWACG